MSEIEKRQITHRLVCDYLHLYMQKKKKRALLVAVSTGIIGIPSLFIALFTISADNVSPLIFSLIFCLVFFGWVFKDVLDFQKAKKAVKQRRYFIFEDKLLDIQTRISRSKYGKKEHRYFSFERFGTFEVDTELSNAFAESTYYDRFYVISLSENKPRVLHVYNTDFYELSSELSDLKR